MPKSAYPLIDESEGVRLCAGERSLYLRMLARFPNDPTAARLSLAISQRQAEIVFLHAHTLKGLCAQLALARMEHLCAALCRMTRDASALTPQMIAAGEAVLLCLRETLFAIRALTERAL